MAETRTIPVICGPTGSGKSAVAMQLAELFQLEIVSADSRQIIRYLNIGTAKPTADDQARVPTHLIDQIEPGERYSVFKFIGDCDRAIGEIIDRGHIPMVVGGTGLYLRGLTEGVIEIEPDRPEIRRRLEQEMESLGAEKMHGRLRGLDPAEAERIHANNRVRVIRALEICELTGQTKTELMAGGAYKKSSYGYSLYCLQPERTVLYDAINERVDSMMKGGLLEEVKTLISRGVQLRRANVIGYEELLDYLDNKCSLEEAVALIKQNSRRYAKRQLTWFRHQSDGAIFSKAEELKAAVRVELETRWTTA